MKNRVPMYFLVLLFLAALVWRAVHPQPPRLPGPLGVSPSWRSMSAIGKMGPSSISPDGRHWAAAWNALDRSKQPYAAVWIIPTSPQRRPVNRRVEPGAVVSSLFWADSNTVRLLITKRSARHRLLSSRLLLFDASNPDSAHTLRLDNQVESILAWPPGSDTMLARLDGTKVTLATLTSQGKIVGKSAVADISSGSHLGALAAISPDGRLFVFSVVQTALGGSLAFYLGNTTDGSTKLLFTTDELPGRVEHLSVSPAGVLLVTAVRDNFQTILYPWDSSRLQTPDQRPEINLALSWPDVPRSMDFLTYDGGFNYAPLSGKKKPVFSFGTTDRLTDLWRREAQDGRLYRAGDYYVSISLAAGAPDIRRITRDGKNQTPILARR